MKRGDEDRRHRNDRLQNSRSRLRWAAAFGSIVLVSAVLLAGLLLNNAASGGGGPPPSRSAAIIDQLSLTVPNRDFRKSASETLKEAGYAVDYYPGDEITVDFFRDLPLRGYDLLVMRVHTGLTDEGDSSTPLLEAGAGFFTNEPWDETKYQKEQLDRRLVRAHYTRGDEEFFAVMPSFVETTMQGRFDGTTIILMGCDGLKTTRTGEAFIARGASGFVSWTDSVVASHTDIATERLLMHLRQGSALTEAVEMTAKEIGPDPYSRAELRILTSGE